MAISGITFDANKTFVGIVPSGYGSGIISGITFMGWNTMDFVTPVGSGTPSEVSFTFVT